MTTEIGPADVTFDTHRLLECGLIGMIYKSENKLVELLLETSSSNDKLAKCQTNASICLTFCHKITVYMYPCLVSLKVIDPEKSNVKMMGTKVEINFKKADSCSWTTLEMPANETSGKTTAENGDH